MPKAKAKPKPKPKLKVEVKTFTEAPKAVRTRRGLEISKSDKTKKEVEKLAPIGPAVIQHAKLEPLSDKNIINFMNSVILGLTHYKMTPLRYCVETYHLEYHEKGEYYTLPGGKMRMVYRGDKFVEVSV